MKHVTTHSAEHLDRNPFPEFHIPPEEIADSASEESVERPKAKRGRQSSKFARLFKKSAGTGTAPAPIDSQVEKTDVLMYKENENAAKEEHAAGATQAVVEDGDAQPSSSSSSSTKVGLIHRAACTTAHRPLYVRERTFLGSVCFASAWTSSVKSALWSRSPRLKL